MFAYFSVMDCLAVGTTARSFVYCEDSKVHWSPREKKYLPIKTSVFVCLSVCLFVYFETGFLCLALAVLELAV